MADAKPKAKGEPEETQSMEEILQSIRRIIAEEGDAPRQEPSLGATGSNVLELTEMLQEDGSVMSVQEEPRLAAPALVSVEEAPPEFQAVSPQAAAEPVIEPVMEEIGELVSTAELDVLKDIDEAITTAPEGESLISEQAAQAAAAALRPILEGVSRKSAKLPSPEFRSGTTVEDLVIEALRPMLKDWLDANLQTIVQRLVEREIRKISDTTD